MKIYCEIEVDESKPKQTEFSNRKTEDRRQKTEDRRQKAEYGPSGYGEGLRRDESGLAMTFFGAFLQRVVARPEKRWHYELIGDKIV